MSSTPANLQSFIKYIKLVSFSRHKINSELIFKDQPWKVARFSISQFYFDKHFTMFCVLLAQRWFILEWQKSSVQKKMQSNSLVVFRIAQSHWLYLWVSVLPPILSVLFSAHGDIQKRFCCFSSPSTMWMYLSRKLSMWYRHNGAERCSHCFKVRYV